MAISSPRVPDTKMNGVSGTRSWAIVRADNPSKLGRE
jgi:hypothetical protein